MQEENTARGFDASQDAALADNLFKVRSGLGDESNANTKSAKPLSRTMSFMNSMNKNSSDYVTNNLNYTNVKVSPPRKKQLTVI